MKYRVLLFGLCIIGTLFAQSWESIGPVGGMVIQVKADPLHPDTIFAVTEGHSEPPHTLWRTFDGGEHWEDIGDYAGVALHPFAPETLLVAFGIGSYSDGIIRSADYGTTFDAMAIYWLYLARGACFDKADPNNAYAWGQFLGYSADAGHTWITPPTPPTTIGLYLGLAIDPFAPDIAWTWRDSGELFRYRDHMASYESVHIFTEDYGPLDVALSALDTSIIYIANWAGISISDDYGDTWTNIAMPSSPTNRIILSEYSTSTIVVGGAYGVKNSFNSGATWGFVGDSIEYEVTDIDIIPDGIIYAATLGNGVMRIDASPFSEGPILSSAFPENGAWVSLDSFEVSLNISDPDGIDESSVILNVNGTAYTDSDPELVVSDTSIVFMGYFDDGDTVEIELSALEDALGNPSDMLPYSWEFNIDRTPPAAVYINPEPDDTVDTTPLVFKMFLVDSGSGLDLSGFLAHFNSVTVFPSCMSFLYESDTVFIDLGAAGLVLEDGDTVVVDITVGDSVDTGEPNIVDDIWQFYVHSTGIREVTLPVGREIVAYPNPFNAVCRIRATADVEVYDFSGRYIATISIADGYGIWDGFDSSGKAVPSGIYLAKPLSGGATKIVLMR